VQKFGTGTSEQALTCTDYYNPSSMCLRNLITCTIITCQSARMRSAERRKVWTRSKSRNYVMRVDVRVCRAYMCGGMVNASDANNKQEMGQRYIRDALAGVVEDGVGTNRIRL
jgi:hypothetical protein